MLQINRKSEVFSQFYPLFYSDLSESINKTNFSLLGYSTGPPGLFKLVHLGKWAIDLRLTFEYEKNFFPK